MQTRKKQNLSQKYWLTKYVIKLLINEWQNLHNLQHILAYIVLVSKQKLKQYYFSLSSGFRWNETVKQQK